MAHSLGERLRCDECGAEIEYVKPCPCPPTDTRQHNDICCGQPMRSLGVQPGRPAAEPAPPAH